MPKLIIDNLGRGGISLSDREGIEGSYSYGLQVNPNIILGYLTPGNKLTTPTGSSVLGARIRKAIVDPQNAKIYALEEGRRLHRADSDVGNLATTGDYPHAIGTTNSSVAGQDLIIYSFNSTNYLLYSWKDSGGGDVGRVNLTGTISFDDTYLSLTVNNTSSLSGTNEESFQFLEWQKNGMLYVSDGRAVHKIDNSTFKGTLTKNNFRLPVGWMITSLFDANEFIGICGIYLPGNTYTGRRSRSMVVFWDGVSTQFTRKVLVPDPEIRASYNLNGEFYIWCKSAFAKGVLRQWDGNHFVKITDIINGNDTNYPINDFGQIDEWKNQLLWQTDGRLFTYGSPQIGYPKALNQIGKTTGTGDGGVVVSSGGTIYAGSLTGTTYYWESFASGADTGFLWKSMFYEFPQKIKINYVKVEFQTTASGVDDDIKLELDYGNSTTTLGNINTSGLEYKSFNFRGNHCNNFRIHIDTDETSSTAGIFYSRIIVDYDFVEGDF